jgi:hypothetical protein
MSISTYFRPNIHQNGPEILGVNTNGEDRIVAGQQCFFSGDQATFVASGSSSLQKYPNVANLHLLQH